jgi:alpha-tubulin suppressor-like RCC1 family protein
VSGACGQSGGAVTRPTSISALAGSVADIVVGGTSSCAILVDQTVKCWGDNLDGKLGIGDSSPPSPHPSPAPVVLASGGPLTTVQDLAVGYSFACAGALATNRYLTCWGGNQHLQLFDGTMTPAAAPHNTAEFPALAGVTAGDDFGCILDGSANQVLCWGAGGQFQLGNNTSQDNGFISVFLQN